MKCGEGTTGRLGRASWSGEAWNFIPVSQEAEEGPRGGQHNLLGMLQHREYIQWTPTELGSPSMQV